MGSTLWHIVLSLRETDCYVVVHTRWRPWVTHRSSMSLNMLMTLVCGHNLAEFCIIYAFKRNSQSFPKPHKISTNALPWRRLIKQFQVSKSSLELPAASQRASQSGRPCYHNQQIHFLINLYFFFCSHRIPWQPHRIIAASLCVTQSNCMSRASAFK